METKRLMDEELKPCPFCGGNAYIVWNAIIRVKDGSGLMHEEYGAVASCDHCPAEIRTTAKHLIVEMWNRRV